MVFAFIIVKTTVIPADIWYFNNFNKKKTIKIKSRKTKKYIRNSQNNKIQKKFNIFKNFFTQEMLSMFLRQEWDNFEGKRPMISENMPEYLHIMHIININLHNSKTALIFGMKVSRVHAYR